MEHLNQNLFLLINAAAQPEPHVVQCAVFFAGYVLWLVPLTLTAGWLRSGEAARRYLVEAVIAVSIALLAAQAICSVWPHPRPFMLGLGTTLIPHAPDPSFPSDHLTFVWTAACSLLLHGRTRRAGAMLALAGVPTAWARIYLGVHFPLDIMGSMLIAVVSATLCARTTHRAAALIVKAATPPYRFVFAPLIRRGWITQ
jgi:undecaprenyl-diphosphatase